MLKNFRYKPYFFSGLIIAGLLSLSRYAYAYSQEISLGQAAQNMLEPMGLLTEGLYKICYIIGGMLIVGAGIQYKNYKQNQSAVRISTPIVLFLLGMAMILLPIISNTSTASPTANMDSQ